jgi:hypothetical protein
LIKSSWTQDNIQINLPIINRGSKLLFWSERSWRCASLLGQSWFFVQNVESILNKHLLPFQLFRLSLLWETMMQCCIRCEIPDGGYASKFCFIDRVTTNPFSRVSVYTCTWTDVVTCRRQFLDWHARFIFLAFFICFLEVKYSNAVSVAMFLLQSGLNEEALYRTFHENFLQNIN